MGLRINTNVAALNAHRQLSATDNALGKSLEKLSSGLRINKAMDDVAGLAIANSFRTEVRGLRTAQQNVAQATAMLQVADGAAVQIEGILERIKELATSASSDNTSAAGRVSLNAEAGQLIAEINRIAGDTAYQGTQLVDGTSGSKEFMIGSSNGTNDTITVNFANIDFDATKLAINDLDISAQASAKAGVAKVDGAVSVAGTSMGYIGAAESRLSFAAANLANTIENLAASESAIRDADMAFELVAFTRNQILLQAGTAMLAQANMAPQSVLSLFG